MIYLKLSKFAHHRKFIVSGHEHGVPKLADRTTILRRLIQTASQLYSVTQHQNIPFLHIYRSLILVDYCKCCCTAAKSLQKNSLPIRQGFQQEIEYIGKREGWEGEMVKGKEEKERGSQGKKEQQVAQMLNEQKTVLSKR